jgi:hypothetical protein
MRRHGLLVATAATILVTGLLVPQLNWIGSRALRGNSPDSADLHVHAHGREALVSETGCRWRQCQASHWRAWMLQH